MKTIAIAPNKTKDIDLEVTRLVVSKLTEAGYTVLTSAVNKKDLKGVKGIAFDSERNVMKRADICIVLGGDGSILKVAGSCAAFGVEILGINLGHIGYMTAIEAAQAERIVQIIESDYLTESRMMLDISIERNGEIIFSGGPVLNDVVLAKSRGYGVIETSIFCKGKMLNKYRGDGLIVSTPTGSTAYSLSAGGPIIDNALDCISLTPICAHSLKSRSIIFGPESEIDVSCSSNLNSSCVTLDGDLAFEINDSDIIHIKRSEHRAKLISAANRTFCSTLYEKLSD